AEDGIRDRNVTGVQTCALPISSGSAPCHLMFSTDNKSVLTLSISSLISATSDKSTVSRNIIVRLSRKILRYSYTRTLIIGYRLRSEERRVGKERKTQKVPSL